MQPDSATAEDASRREAYDAGRHMLTVCNACRYCEQFCPMFPAMERRLTFANADLAYLANLCHNCGECLYACQYAPPHEFGVNVPKALAQIRAFSYEEHSWPHAFGAAFRRHSVLTGMALAGAMAALMIAGTLAADRVALWSGDASGDFYAVVPHDVMVGLFGGVAFFVVAALWIACARFWVATRSLSRTVAAGNHAGAGSTSAWGSMLRDVLTLRHLHVDGISCTSREETRTPWRRWFHHCTFYGFMLCAASTSVAAFYHQLGWPAPYEYTSLPVVLGTLGGVGLLAGPLGLAILRRARDPELGDASQQGLDTSFLALLFLTSLTGLALLVLRHEPAMGVLLIVHLGSVLALFLTLPYGKFVHGLYRALALLQHHREERG